MSAVMKSTRRARSIMWITKTIRITNGTEHDIDIQVKAVHQNQCGLIRQAHIQEEIISRPQITFHCHSTHEYLNIII